MRVKPHDIFSTPAAMPAITRMVPTPAVGLVISPNVTGGWNGIGRANIDDTRWRSIHRPYTGRCDHAASEGGD